MDATYNVFLSHNSEDKSEVEKLALGLQDEAGLNPWLDAWHITGGVKWEDEINQALSSCSTCAVILGEHGWGEYHLREARAALARRETYPSFRVIPVLLPGAREEDTDELPDFFAETQWINFREGTDDQDALRRLAAAVRGEVPYREGRPNRSYQIRRDARRWGQTKPQDESLLYRGDELQRAQQWASDHSDEMNPLAWTFLQSGLELEQQKREARERLRRRITGGLVVGLVVTTVLCLAASVAAIVALNRSQVAEKRAQIALSRQLATQALTHLDDRVDLALLLSLEANRIADELEARGSLLDILEHNPRLAAFLRGLLSKVPDVASSPIEYLLASVSRNGTIEARGSLLDILEHNPRIVTFLRGHIGEVTDVAFSPDGNLLASGSRYGTVTLWDVENRQSLGTPLTGHIDVVTDIAFSPDGNLLASGSWDTTVLLWDVASRKRLAPPLKGHSTRIESLAFSPSGQTLASGGQDGTIFLWDVAAPQPLGSPLTLHDRAVTSLTFSPDGGTLASASLDGRIMLWDAATREHIDTLVSDRQSELRSIAFGPDGSTLAAGSEDGAIILWNVKTRESLDEPLTGHEAGVLGVAFSPDGKVLASGGKDGTIILWDVATHRPLDPNQPLTGHTDWVTGIAFSPDGNLLASGSEDKTIILWDMADLVTRTGHNAPVFSVAYSPDSSVLASGSEDKRIILWDVESREPLGLPLEGHSHEVYSVAFSPDAKTLASSSCAQKDSGLCIEGEIRLWDMEDRQPIGPPLTGHNDSIESVAFSPDGKMLVSGGCGSTDEKNRKQCQTGEILLWDVATRQPLDPPLSGHSDKAESVAFSPDGRMLASAGQDGTIILWDVATRQPLGPPLTGHSDKVESVAFSPDGLMLASAGQDTSVILWDVTARQPLGPPLKGHGDWVLSVAFSPDGRMLASGGTDNSIVLWDVATHQVIGSPLTGHVGWIYSLAFSPDGNQLASNSGDNAIILRDVNLDLWKKRACQTANRSLSWLEWKQYLGDQKASSYQAPCPGASIYLADAFEQAKAFALAEGTEQSLAILAQAVQSAVETENAALNDYFCWNGSVDGLAESVMAACERAVELDSDNARYRDSRGLARVLTGDFEGAIKDFESYIEWGQNQGRRFEERLRKRQDWIEQLETGHNPFDEAVLKELRQE
jgi:WD40 repeat protein